MPFFPSRPIFAGLTLVVLPLALACGRIETDASCLDPNRDRPEQRVVETAMERAYDQVDFRFCRNQKCLVEVEAGTGCDVQTIRDCVTRHIIAAQGVPVARASEATLKLTSTISRFRLDHQDRILTPDVDFGEFRGRLDVTELGPGAAQRLFKLKGRAQRAVL
jgi:hypothetical protein